MRKALVIPSLIFVAFLALLVGCQPDTPATAEAPLTVSAGEREETYTVIELEALSATEATFDGKTYVGVPLAALLADAGIDPGSVSEVTAVAVDDFSATYTPEQIARPDTLVAYARPDGPLANDEQPFRMVLPGEPGRLNVRLLSRLEVSQ